MFSVRDVPNSARFEACSAANALTSNPLSTTCGTYRNIAHDNTEHYAQEDSEHRAQGFGTSRPKIRRKRLKNLSQFAP